MTGLSFGFTFDNIWFITVWRVPKAEKNILKIISYLHFGLILKMKCAGVMGNTNEERRTEFRPKRIFQTLPEAQRTQGIDCVVLKCAG